MFDVTFVINVNYINSDRNHVRQYVYKRIILAKLPGDEEIILIKSGAKYLEMTHYDTHSNIYHREDGALILYHNIELNNKEEFDGFIAMYLEYGFIKCDHYYNL